MKFWNKRFCWPAFLLICLSSSVPAQTLQQALDATNLTWATSGVGWIGQTNITYDGVSAASSRTLSGFGSSSTLQTTVTGPGTVTFWCNMPAGDANLSFVVGTVTQAVFSYEPFWSQKTFYVGSGTQTLKWIYSLLPGSMFTFNAAYIDQVSWVPGTTAPVITGQPFSQQTVPGCNAKFLMGAGGTPPLNYQWQFNGTNIPGATNSSLTISNTQAADLGSYRTIVTNSQGTNVTADALLIFGKLAVWGLNITNTSRGIAPLEATNIMQISCGSAHNLILRSNRTVFAWGGSPSIRGFPEVVNIPPDLLNTIAVDGNSDSSFTLSEDGTIHVWGYETNAPPDLTNVVAIAKGPQAFHSLVLKTDGIVISWGDNSLGETNVPEDLTNAVAVAAGYSHSIALKADGTIVAWGDNTFGKTNVPAGLTNVVAVAAGVFHSMALKADGTVAAWGGFDNTVTNVPQGLSNVVAIAAGSDHCLALRANGTVVAWGRNNSGGQTNVPVGLSNVVAIAAGSGLSLALVGDGPPVLSASICNPVLSSNGFSFSIPSQSGRVYMLEYKNSLEDTAWTALPLMAGNGTDLTMTDCSATNSQRFYRVRRW